MTSIRRPRTGYLALPHPAVGEAPGRGDRSPRPRVPSGPRRLATAESCWSAATTCRRWSITTARCARPLRSLPRKQQAPITTEEFHTPERLSRHGYRGSRDGAHAHVGGPKPTTEIERLGRATHEFRNLLNAAFLAFGALKHTRSPSTEARVLVLGRSLMGLRGMIDSTLSSFASPVSPLARADPCLAFHRYRDVVANLHTEYRDITLRRRNPSAGTWSIDADPQLLSSAVMNLLINAFKYTRPRGRVDLSARAEARPPADRGRRRVRRVSGDSTDPFRPFGEQRGRERPGLGLGLSIARQAIRAHGGDIHIRNLPGKGCVFVAELPLAAQQQAG